MPSLVEILEPDPNRPHKGERFDEYLLRQVRRAFDRTRIEPDTEYRIQAYVNGILQGEWIRQTLNKPSYVNVVVYRDSARLSVGPSPGLVYDGQYWQEPS